MTSNLVCAACGAGDPPDSHGVCPICGARGRALAPGSAPAPAVISTRPSGRRRYDWMDPPSEGGAEVEP
jgi:hypothetical protein